MSSIRFTTTLCQQTGTSLLELIISLLLLGIIIGEPLAVAINQSRLLHRWQFQERVFERVLLMRALLASDLDLGLKFGNENELPAVCERRNSAQYCRIETPLPVEVTAAKIFLWQ